MKVYHLAVTLPLPEPGPEIQKIDRWYQLDAASLVLAEFGARVLLPLPRPQGIVLCSPAGSNESDQAFVRSALTSPQKFVHTLPSVRLSPLCQLLQWEGPALCLQGGPRAMAQALQQGCELLSKWPHLWVCGVRRRENSLYDAVLFDLTVGSEEACRGWLDYGDLPFWERVRQV